MKTGRGWAVESKRWLANWVEPTKTRVKETIIGEGLMPMTPADKIVRVRILKESDYRKLIKNQKAEK